MNHKTLKAAAAAILGFAAFHPHAHAALIIGDIAFTGFDADTEDNFSFVLLTAVAGGQVIYFNDNEWNSLAIGSGGAFLDNNEGEITWTAPIGGLLAGTVVSITNASGATAGSISGSIGLAGENEMIYAFLGSAGSPTQFLAAIGNDVEANSGSLTNTGLTNGVTAFVLAGDEDIMAYTGPRTTLTNFASYLPFLTASSNWITQDGGGDQSVDSIAPDQPFDTTSFAIPEPGTVAALAAGLLGVLALRRRK